MRSYAWSLIKVVLVIFFVFIFKASFAQDIDDGFWTYLNFFVNKTPHKYKVYVSCNPAVVPEERGWLPVLSLLAYNGDEKSEEYVGQTFDILLKDPLGNGCDIKIEPEDKNSGAQTFYIRIGLKSSGDCVYAWLKGPYDISISPVDHIIRDEVVQKASPEKMPTDQQIRFCGYQNSILGVILDGDTLEFVARHRSSVLDKGKYSVYQQVDKEVDKANEVKK
ncbi:hypothetical protein A3F66_00100 [candidate division TM6 bacterium RIFCSPHIGHO2_12_FULL_32_22]|nr:MAG: hypothetical protein A3F66_00100 [candidate division TM6 bacterium RIFCSPHIGHO2_12_FULL_32_22]